MFYIGVDVPMQRWPYTNWALILLTIIVSIAAWGKHRNAERDFRAILTEAADPTNVQGKSEDDVARIIERLEKAHDDALIGALQPEKFRMTQLFTHALVHGDFWHLLGNMIFLFAFGNAINAKLGHLQFLACYFFFAAFAGLGWMILGNGMPMVGASGAIMGIAGMFFVLYPLNELAIHTPDTYIWSGDAWRMPSWIFVLIYMILDLIGMASKDQGIAYAAHIAGEVGGFALACLLVKLGWVTSDRGEKNLPEMWGWIEEEAPRPLKCRRLKPKPKPKRDVDL